MDFDASPKKLPFDAAMLTVIVEMHLDLSGVLHFFFVSSLLKQKVDPLFVTACAKNLTFFSIFVVHMQSLEVHIEL